MIGGRSKKKPRCPSCNSTDWSPELAWCISCDYSPRVEKKQDAGRITNFLPEEMRIPEFPEEEIVASICRASFYEFVREFWETIIPQEPVWNWHIEYLCDELQKMAERVFRNKPKLYDLIINISPGTTKSTICSVMFPAWCWTRMPSCRNICASYSYLLAMDLSRKCRDVVKSEKYQKCFPEVQIREDQDSKAYFVNTSGGDRYSVGVNGSVMGMHGHFIIVDDPLDPQQSFSDADIKTANDWMSETLPSRKVDKRITPMILIMQRLHQNDPTGHRLEKLENNPVKHICLPAEESDRIHPPHLRMYYQDGLMDPVRMPRKTLQAAFAELREYGYAGQFMQSPVPRGGGMFQVGELKFGHPPARFRRIVRYWDKAASDGKGDYTVGLKMGLDYEDRLWILDVVRHQWDSSRREKWMKNVATLDGGTVLTVIEQEGGGGGKESAENSVRNLRGYRVKIHKVSKSDGDKTERADPFSSQVNAGNVYMVEAPWNQAFISELQYFPRSKYKDQVDAASGAFNELAGGTHVVGGLSCMKK